MLAKPGLFKRDAASPAVHPTSTSNTTAPLGALKAATSVHAQPTESVPLSVLRWRPQKQGDLLPRGRSSHNLQPPDRS